MIHSACRAISRGRMPCLPLDVTLWAAFPTLLEATVSRFLSPLTCHGAAVIWRNYSSAASLTHPEMLAVPLQLLLGQPSSGTRTTIARSFSSQSDTREPSRGTCTTIARSFSSQDDKILLPNEEKIIDPFQEGTIRADLGFFRPRPEKGVFNPVRLPIVRQTSFHEEQDVYLTPWEIPRVFLINVPAFKPAGSNPLLKGYGIK